MPVTIVRFTLKSLSAVVSVQKWALTESRFEEDNNLFITPISYITTTGNSLIVIMYISKRAINKSLVRLRKNALRDRALPAGGCIRTTCQRTMGRIGLNLKASYINLICRASWGFIYRPHHVTWNRPELGAKIRRQLHDSLRWLGCNALND